MQFVFILTLIFAVLVAIFASQNAYPVTIYFLKWQFEASFGLVILISLLIGAISFGSLGLVHQAKSRLKRTNKAKGPAVENLVPEEIDAKVKVKEPGGVDDSPQKVED